MNASDFMLWLGEQRAEVVELIVSSSHTRMVGGYRRRNDESRIDEWNEGILATLKGYLVE